MNMKMLLAAAAATIVLPAHAGDFTNLGALSQQEFRLVSEDLGAAFSYKGVTPAKRLGPAGFDVGVEVTQTQLENSSLFAKAGAGDLGDVLVPKFHVNAGFFGGFDIGAFIGGTSDLDATVFGMDFRYAVLEDTLTTPAVAVRMSGTRTNGMAIRVGTVAADVMVSKTLTLLTPYGGVGIARVRSKASGSALSDETFNKGRFFGGVNLNMGIANFAIEAEKMGDNASYSAKVGLRF
jgi:opacity protein-like surface antigen